MKLILFVEDDPDQIMMYNDKFELEGLSMMVAGDTDETIKIARRDRPDLILLDLLLPKENGLEILEKVRQDEQLKKIPVIVFTNLDKEEFREKATQLGVLDYIIKVQTTPGEIAKKIKEIIGSD